MNRGTPLELGYDKWTNNFYFNKEFVMQSVHYLMGNQRLLIIQNKSVLLPNLEVEKVKNISGALKTSLLVIPILILILLGGLVNYLRSRRFGR